MELLPNSGNYTNKKGERKYIAFMSCGCEHVLTFDPVIGEQEIKVKDYHNRRDGHLLFVAPEGLKIKRVESKHCKW